MNNFNLGRDLYLKGRIGWRGLSKDEYLPFSEYKIINATSLMDGYVDWNNCGFISKERYEESPEIMLQEGDILISKDGTLGKIGYVKDITTPCTVASGVFVLRNTIPHKLSFDYLYHVLKSSIFKNFISRNKAIGSTISHLYQVDLEEFELELPDIDEQRRIASILDSLDFKISNNVSICSNLEAMAKLLYDYWFVQFDFPDENGQPYKSSGGKMVWNEDLKREIPAGWEVGTISDYCRIFTGKKDVNQANIIGKYKFYSCAPEYRFSDDKLYEGKAILVSGNGSYTGRTIFVNDAFDLYQRTYALTPLSGTVPLVYIFYSMLRFFVPVVSGGTHGSAIPYIVYGDIANQRILYNQDIVNRFERISTNLQDRIIALEKENQQLSSLRDFLLPMLMNGQVKVGA